MNFLERNFFPIILPSETGSSGGMLVIPEHAVIRTNSGRNFVRKDTGEEFCLLNNLKDFCRFGTSGVLAAFSNFQIHVPVTYRIGRITKINFQEYLPENIDRNLVLIAAPMFAGVQGNLSLNECIFPSLQNHGPGHINLTASAFDGCPADFCPVVHHTFYLGIERKDPREILLQRSVWEFSQNRASFACVYLYAAIEAAVTDLTGEVGGKISTRLATFISQIDDNMSASKPLVRRLKKSIEKHVVARRGDFAHKGIQLTQADLLESYEVALELFWNFDDLMRVERA